jgi:hypothetical protein
VETSIKNFGKGQGKIGKIKIETKDNNLITVTKC